MQIQRELHLCRSNEYSEQNSAPFLRDRATAVQKLQRLKSDPLAMSAIRRMLHQEHGSQRLSKLSDDALIEKAADLLVSRRIHYRIEPRARTAGASSSVAPKSASPAFPLAERASPAPAPTTRSVPVAADPPTLPPNIDPAAQAATLKKAAEQGAPFCEMCATA
jgi:hypothetical protein